MESNLLSKMNEIQQVVIDFTTKNSKLSPSSPFINTDWIVSVGKNNIEADAKKDTAVLLNFCTNDDSTILEDRCGKDLHAIRPTTHDLPQHADQATEPEIDPIQCRRHHQTPYGRRADIMETQGSFILAISDGTDRQQLETFSSRNQFRPERIALILRQTIDGNLQSNRTKISIPFRRKRQL
uniref:Uncharacterized protein n=1 Tax=Romanomermis culicivorax TaxID=13658 RepID=A0A915JXP2_ROMCU